MQHRRVIKFANLIKAFNGIDNFKEFFWLLRFLNKGVTLGLDTALVQVQFVFSYCVRKSCRDLD